MRRDVAELRRLIAAAGLTQMSASKALGIAPRAMQYYCQRDRTEPVPTVVMVAMRGLAADAAKNSENT